MYCPVCDSIRMREVEKEGVLIDICPQCKGVWLDRGELDKLLKEARDFQQPFNQWYDEYDPRKHHHPSGKSTYPKPKKKKSFLDKLGDIFD
ncbi:Zn-finger nucleic acid-binding protein [Pullulanibacillus pueri]|uniref:Transcription factor zinc-finger domain-containing protein n=1 Tax=Pullulanibacillus pueri TaxID=1437324 RepID=A0A8J3ELY8_9BACL|nr:zf-TFIIB domain-containing protein [Pullulanibacillus pueri]MBM7682263.1 Zn-finger nucleic acid-binding protein [Pullulanibacillus pueri]GGH81034.1 hypothetical protein GCM10007096_18330 [Pullulanibacillus pueri]